MQYTFIEYGLCVPGLVLGVGNIAMTHAWSQILFLRREGVWRWAVGGLGHFLGLVAIREGRLKGHCPAAAPDPPGRTFHTVTLVVSLWACHIIHRQPEMPPAKYTSFPQFIFQSGGFTKIYTIKSKISPTCHMGKTCFASACVCISM